MAILNKPLNYGGRLFAVGENIRGHVPLDMIQLLEKEGAVSTEEAPEEQGLPSSATDPSSEQMKTVEELSEYLKTVNEAETVQALLKEEQEKDKPRAGAVRLLEARLKEIQDERV
ncbi:hypothetical protein QUF95_15525 [Paenibacillus silvae]|uniref:hypothetical protein n=1 Tax=Paenibacillus silvae TaxID=1325358 RepID=UPI0025A032A9|nr:hypothetical protein [Paenibacillus silvae]MDM5278808.1 hypothetical protein [Paenibacillus silvae]